MPNITNTARLAITATGWETLMSGCRAVTPPSNQSRRPARLNGETCGSEDEGGLAGVVLGGLGELRGVGLGEVDVVLLLLDHVAEGAEYVEHGLGSTVGHHAVGGEHRRGVLDRLLVERRVPTVVVLRHPGRDLGRRVG